ncbi:MAG: RNA-binding cell elongation regulator Jag/EloR [Bacillota bacterium]|nr:RNA-binding cell elongation regulator Jag/EloR [Bacillota bacterium]
MLKEYEASGKTLDEAIDMVCLRAGRTIDELNIEVLEMPAKGFLGIGHRDARVRASYEVPDEAPAAAPAKPSTFGQKRSKQERIEKKKARTQEELEIKPIVSIDPAAVTEELRQQVRSSNPPKARPERRPRWEDAPGAEGSERPERAERAERPQQNKQARPTAERKNKQNQQNRPAQSRELPAGEKLSLEQEAEARRRAAARRESRATAITEGEMADSITALCVSFLNPIFAKLQISPNMETEIREGALWICFSGESLGLLIGRRGETLNALQYLCNLVVNKGRNDHIRVVLDVEGYREGREETLAALAHKMAEKAVRTGRRIELEPMNPHERRVVHLALQNDKRVDTVSHGEEPYRRVVISKKGGSRRRRGKGGNRPQNQNRNQQAPAEQPQTQPALSDEQA